MSPEQIASALSEIGTLLELRGENPFKSNAYHNGARTIEQTTEDIPNLVEEGRLGEIRGIGSTLQTVITALVREGRAPLLDELRAATPPGLLQMLRLPGMGPKKVKALHEAGISDLVALKTACDSGLVAKLKGFGGKTQEKILAGLSFVEQTGKRIRIDEASSTLR